MPTHPAVRGRAAPDEASTKRLGIIGRRTVLRWGMLALTSVAAQGGLACRASRDPATGDDGPNPEQGSPSLSTFEGSVDAGPPADLPQRVAWANTTDSEDFAALGRGMKSAARDRGLDYVTAIADGDPARNVEQMESFLAQGIASLTVQPLDQSAQRRVLERALERGVCVQGIITHPSSLQVVADQYRIGYTQGKAAADHALAELSGEAEVHYFSSASLSPPLASRRQGVLDGLRTAGLGVRVVSDAPPLERSIEGAFDTMASVIQRHPDIKIVLGSDTFVVGAYRALEQAGRLAEDMYFGGVDGDGPALELVRQGGPYRASQAFAWRLMGYAMGQFGADWVSGRTIPRVVIANSTLLDSAASVDAFLADNDDASGVFAQRTRLDPYFSLLGTTSFASREVTWREDYVLP